MQANQAKDEKREMILETLVVGPFGSSCFIVGSAETGKGMIVDPGAEGQRIMNTLQQLGLSAELIVITHGHIDHVAAAKQVKEATGAKLAIHEAEGQEKAFNATTQLLAGLAFIGGSADDLPEPDILLKDGDTVKAGDLSFQVLHTPGHSPGGLCLVGHGVVFTGDTLFNYGIGRTDFPGCSFDDLMNSIHGKLMPLPDDTRVYPGHGPETTIGAERLGNPFLRM